MNISIVIRAYNEAGHIERLIWGVHQQTVQPVEIILVDSGSTDGTAQIANQMGARVIPIEKEEFTFGRALNLGCSEARGDYLVFASAHVYPTHNRWLEYLVSPLEQRDVILSYGMQRGNEISKFSETQLFRKWFPEQSELRQKNYFCNNANAAIRKADWRKCQYNEELTGLEDLDWAKRMMGPNSVVAYVAEAGIVHVHDEEWSGVRNRYRREAMALKRIVPTSMNVLEFAFVLVANVFNDACAAMAEGRRWGVLREILLFRWNQFFGTYIGYKYRGELSNELRERLYYPVRPRDRTGGVKANADVIDYKQLNFERRRC